MIAFNRKNNHLYRLVLARPLLSCDKCHLLIINILLILLWLGWKVNPPIFPLLVSKMDVLNV